MTDIEKEIDRDGNLTIFTVTGEIDHEQIIEELRKFYASDFTNNVLWDFTGANSIKLQAAHLKQIISVAKEHAHLREGGRTAFLISRDLELGMGQMYKAIAEIRGHPIRHFTSRCVDEAKKWLQSGELPDEY
jgi:hypothetical protein